MNTTAMNQATAMNWAQPELAPLQTFLQQQAIPKISWPHLVYLSRNELPKPYDFLLTQPLITIAIAHHYQRTPQIRPPLYVIEDTASRYYSRAITMVVDQDKQRDAALLADNKDQSILAELGLITMNLQVLTHSFMEKVRYSSTPFGALLKQAHIPVHSLHARYFTIECKKPLSDILGCKPGSLLYGRTNTLSHDTTHCWLAKTVEILAETTP